MTDYYAALGVSKTANAADIKQAFRKLASQHHPDKGGDTKKFQEIQAAYAVLGDEQKRAEYDNPRPQFSGFGGHPGAPNFNFDDIFSMFGARMNGQHPESGRRQHSQRAQIWISIHDVATGGPRTIALGTPAGQVAIEITIPPGTDDGDNVKYANIMPDGSDLIIQYRVRPDNTFIRQGDNVIKDISVSFWDLILGTEIETNTVKGTTVSVRVPPMTQPGAMLRLRGYGIPNKQRPFTGDMMLRVNAQLPENISEDLKDQIRAHTQK